jgi:hypothetical protein
MTSRMVPVIERRSAEDFQHHRTDAFVVEDGFR